MKPSSEHEIQKQAVDLLSKGNAKNINQDEPGTLLYSPSQSSGQILILLSGSVRLIDDKKTFNSLTLAKLEAPQIFGVDQLLNTHSFSAVLIQIDIEIEYRIGDVGVIHSVVQCFNVELLEALVVCIPRHRTCIMQWWLRLLLAFPLQDYGTSPLMTR